VYRLQNRIGVQLQQAQLQKRIKVWEAVDLWASLYSKSGGRQPPARTTRPRQQTGRLVHDALGRAEAALFIALALINDPEVVFLDELTTGLDPQARRAIWELVRGIATAAKRSL